MKTSLKNFFLGSFVSLHQPNYLLGAIDSTIEFGGKSMMFFLGSPRIFRTIPREKLNRTEFHIALQKNKLSLKNVVIHASYLINLANFSNLRVFRSSISLLTSILETASFLEIEKVVLHPGSSGKNDRKKSMQSIAHALDEVLPKFPKIELCLETMAGQGSEIGKNFAELAEIINQAKSKKQIKVCFDLCHLFAAGYNLINNWSGILAEFNQLIGLDKLAIVHVNDSLQPLGSARDRHANIGKGKIGLKAIVEILNTASLQGIPLILETPYIDKLPPYKKEITILTNEYLKNKN